eukprot:gene14861-20921_t
MLLHQRNRLDRSSRSQIRRQLSDSNFGQLVAFKFAGSSRGRRPRRACQFIVDPSDNPHAPCVHMRETPRV